MQASPSKKHILVLRPRPTSNGEGRLEGCGPSR